jgi:TRAP-type mannitol/chloroaromatic compound transport system permease small subunit
MLFIDRLNSLIGKAVSWLSLLLVLIIVLDVALRYIFSITSAASFELEWHLFAVLFLIGSAYTLQHDKHVRVDVFYHRFSEKRKAWVNLIGTMFLLFPFCLVGFIEALPFVESSYAFRETSPDPGGLPARYLIKSTIPVGFFLLALQGVSELLKSIKTLRHHD